MKTFFSSFPIELAYILQRLCRPLGRDKAVPKLDRGNLLLRLKGAEKVADLVGRPVVAVWGTARRKKEGKERRPVLTLIAGAPQTVCPNRSEELLEWLLREVAENAGPEE